MACAIHGTRIMNIPLNRIPLNDCLNKYSYKRINFGNMKVIPINVKEKQYMYILYDDQLNATVVDPCEWEAVMSTVKRLGLKLTHILTTHYDTNKMGCNSNIMAKIPEVIICGINEHIEAVNHIIKEGDIIHIGSISLNCIAINWSDKFHVCYYANDTISEGPACLFTGNTLLIGGCGNFNDSSAEQLIDAFINTFAKLPTDTLVYCNQDNAYDNYCFASQLYPDNAVFVEKLKWSIMHLNNKRPTIPSTIGEELRTNVFMLTSPDMQEKLGCTSTLELMRKLKEKKIQFKPFKRCTKGRKKTQ